MVLCNIPKGPLNRGISLAGMVFPLGRPPEQIHQSNLGHLHKSLCSTSPLLDGAFFMVRSCGAGVQTQYSASYFSSYFALPLPSLRIMQTLKWGLKMGFLNGMFFQNLLPPKSTCSLKDADAILFQPPRPSKSQELAGYSDTSN